MNTTPQSGRSTIDSFAKRLLCRIVRELEEIPEPMQLSLLDFIRSLGNSYTTTNQPETISVGSQKRNPSINRRTTSTLIAGKGKQ